MDSAQLREIMKYHLTNFSTNDNGITDETVHKTILSESDGTGTANSKRLYKSFIRWTLLKAGLDDKTWPAKWMDMSVTDLSNKLIGE